MDNKGITVLSLFDGMSRSYDHSGDGVKHRCICGLSMTMMSLYDDCDKWEDYKHESR